MDSGDTLKLERDGHLFAGPKPPVSIWWPRYYVEGGKLYSTFGPGTGTLEYGGEWEEIEEDGETVSRRVRH